MTDIITVDDLAAILRLPADSLDTDSSAAYIVDLTNRLVSELIGPTAVITAEVESITLGVAKRAWVNPLGTSSITRAFDDTSRTDRWEHGAMGTNVSTKAVYLTDEEKADLLAAIGHAQPVQTIRTSPMFMPGGVW